MSINEKNIIEITKGYDDIKNQIKKLNQLKKQVKKERIALNNSIKENQFLLDIVTHIGTDLESKIAIFLTKIGVYNESEIILVDDIKYEDVQILKPNRLTLIEVKGKKSDGVVPFDDITVITRYMSTRKGEGEQKELHGIFITNNNIKEPLYSKKGNKAFDGERHKNGINMNYGMVTTMELLKGYKLLRNNQLTPEKFDEALHEKGIIKFKKHNN